MSRDALPVLERALESDGLSASPKVDPDDKHVLYVEYERVAGDSSYSQPAVMLEFGARSTGEPCEVRPVVCDAAPHLPMLEFPSASPRVMRVERTFWEKATAVHVFCIGGKLRGDRFSRPWYDLVQLHEQGHAANAIAARDVAMQVARHKQAFFVEKDKAGQVISYSDSVSGGLRLVPEGESRRVLAEDYRRMVDDGLLLGEAPTFDELLERCGDIEQRANSVKS